MLFSLSLTNDGNDRVYLTEGKCGRLKCHSNPILPSLLLIVAWIAPIAYTHASPLKVPLESPLAFLIGITAIHALRQLLSVVLSKNKDSHIAPIGIASIATVFTPPILLQETICSFILRNGPMLARDIVKHEVQTLALVIHVVHVLAWLELPLLGEVLGCFLDTLYRAGVVAWPGGSVVIASCGGEGN